MPPYHAICERCRKRKVKCDGADPCETCTRLKVQCVMPDFDPFRQYKKPKSKRNQRRRGNSAESEPRQDAATNSENLTFMSDAQYSSATLHLANDVLPPSMSPTTSTATSAIPGGHETIGPMTSSYQQSSSVEPTSNSAKNGSIQIDQSTVDDSMMFDNTSTAAAVSQLPLPQSKGTTQISQQDTRDFRALLEQLPSDSEIDVLVEIYFEKVHWFLLVFHQGWFRERLSSFKNDCRILSSAKEEDFQFLCLLLTVLILASKTSFQESDVTHQLRNFKNPSLVDKYISILQQQTFRIIHNPTLQSVQTLILLANYYLWHGSPQLAWPTLGMAIRNAQVLKLHRKDHPRELAISNEICSGVTFGEAQKRCWWTLYDLDRFCAMVYGYPMGINDEDCDIDLPEDMLHPLQRVPRSDPTSFLSYKVHLSKLSIIIGDVLSHLYRPGRLPSQKDNQNTQNILSGIRRMMIQTLRLNKRLKQWQESLPPRLRLDWNLVRLEGGNNSTSASSIPSDFEDYIFKMQALSLQLAFDNAMILTHRPLLSVKMNKQSQSNIVLSTLARQVSAASQKCRDAALRTSRLQTHPSILVSRNTYAAAYIGLNLLSAGTVLCLLASNGLHKSKLQEDIEGIKRIFEMFQLFKGTSPLVIQGHDLLKVLVKSVLKDKYDFIIGSDIDQSLSLVGISSIDSSTEGFSSVTIASSLTAPLHFGSGMNLEIQNHNNSLDVSGILDNGSEMTNQEIEDFFARLGETPEYGFDDAFQVDLSDGKGLFAGTHSSDTFQDPTWIWNLEDFGEFDSI